MNKIEQRMNREIRAILDSGEHQYVRFGNMEIGRTRDGRGCAVVALHGNVIARIERVGGRYSGQVSLAGGPTATIRSRLNALASEFGSPRFHESRGQQFANGRPVDVKDWIGF